MAERDNSGKFVKGNSGNPRGRPRTGQALSDFVRGFLEGKDPEEKRVRREILVEIVYQKAKDGDLSSFHALMDRGYGKVPQQTIMTGADDGPVEIDVKDVILGKLFAQFGESKNSAIPEES